MKKYNVATRAPFPVLDGILFPSHIKVKNVSMSAVCFRKSQCITPNLYDHLHLRLIYDHPVDFYFLLFE